MKENIFEVESPEPTPVFSRHTPKMRGFFWLVRFDPDDGSMIDPLVPTPDRRIVATACRRFGDRGTSGYLLMTDTSRAPEGATIAVKADFWHLLEYVPSLKGRAFYNTRPSHGNFFEVY